MDLIFAKIKQPPLGGWSFIVTTIFILVSEYTEKAKLTLKLKV